MKPLRSLLILLHLLLYLLLYLLLAGVVPGTVRSASTPLGIPDAARDHELGRRVLEQNYIHITGEGVVEVPYSRALVLLDRDDLLTSVQSAYEDLLEEGEEPEFVITLKQPGHYSYVNQKEQRTEIVELLRAQNREDQTELVLYSKGTRSFGRFQALTHVRVQPAAEDPEHSRWDVQVFAYPENGVSRFFARTFGIAQRYFTRKTGDISKLTTDICLHLIQNESPSPPAVRRAPK